MRLASRINADPSLTLRMTKKEKQDDRSDAQKFVTLSECEESPLVRLVSRINADPSLTLRMTSFYWFHGFSVQNARTSHMPRLCAN